MASAVEEALDNLRARDLPAMERYFPLHELRKSEQNLMKVKKMYEGVGPLPYHKDEVPMDEVNNLARLVVAEKPIVTTSNGGPVYPE